jgi:hypothetical protein
MQSLHSYLLLSSAGNVEDDVTFLLILFEEWCLNNTPQYKSKLLNYELYKLAITIYIIYIFYISWADKSLQCFTLVN